MGCPALYSSPTCRRLATDTTGPSIGARRVITRALMMASALVVERSLIVGINPSKATIDSATIDFTNGEMRLDGGEAIVFDSAAGSAGISFEGSPGSFSSSASRACCARASNVFFFSAAGLAENSTAFEIETSRCQVSFAFGASETPLRMGILSFATILYSTLTLEVLFVWSPAIVPDEPITFVEAVNIRLELGAISPVRGAAMVRALAGRPEADRTSLP